MAGRTTPQAKSGAWSAVCRPPRSPSKRSDQRRRAWFQSISTSRRPGPAGRGSTGRSVGSQWVPPARREPDAGGEPHLHPHRDPAHRPAVPHAEAGSGQGQRFVGARPCAGRSGAARARGREGRGPPGGGCAGRGRSREATLADFRNGGARPRAKGGRTGAAPEGHPLRDERPARAQEARAGAREDGQEPFLEGLVAHHLAHHHVEGPRRAGRDARRRGRPRRGRRRRSRGRGASITGTSTASRSTATTRRAPSGRRRHRPDPGAGAEVEHGRRPGARAAASARWKARLRRASPSSVCW